MRYGSRSACPAYPSGSAVACGTRLGQLCCGSRQVEVVPRACMGQCAHRGSKPGRGRIHIANRGSGRNRSRNPGLHVRIAAQRAVGPSKNGLIVEVVRLCSTFCHDPVVGLVGFCGLLRRSESVLEDTEQVCPRAGLRVHRLLHVVAELLHVLLEALVFLAIGRPQVSLVLRPESCPPLDGIGQGMHSLLRFAGAVERRLERGRHARRLSSGRILAPTWPIGCSDALTLALFRSYAGNSAVPPLLALPLPSPLRSLQESCFLRAPRHNHREDGEAGQSSHCCLPPRPIRERICWRWLGPVPWCSASRESALALTLAPRRSLRRIRARCNRLWRCQGGLLTAVSAHTTPPWVPLGRQLSHTGVC